MWRNNFLPTQVQREVYYRRRYLKIVCGVISIAVLLQVVSYWGYRYFLFKNSDSANTATAMPYVKDAVKVIDQKRCDIPLSSDLALRAIFSVSENARVVLENKAGEKIIWKKGDYWENTCWQLVIIEFDHVVLCHSGTQESVVWRMAN